MKGFDNVNVLKFQATEEQFAKFVNFVNTFKFNEADSKEEFDFLAALKNSLSQETALSSLYKVQMTDEQAHTSIGYAYLFNDASFTVLNAKAGTCVGETLIKEIGEDLLEYVALGFKSDSQEEPEFSYGFGGSVSNIQKLAEILEEPMTQDEIQTELLLVDQLNDMGFDSL